MTTKLFSLLTLLFFCLLGQAQTISLDHLDRKSAKKYKKALACLKKGHRDKGIMKLEEVVEKYPAFTKGAEKLAGIYVDDGENEKATALLERMNACSDQPSPKVAMTLSHTYEAKRDYDKAISIVDDLLAKGRLTSLQKKKVTHRAAELKFRKSAYSNPVQLDPIRLSSAINTKQIEYHPGFNADGSTMIYVKVEEEGQFRNENLYAATKLGVDSFSVGEPITALNSAVQEGAFSLSQDGNILIFTGCEYRDAVGGCDLYMSFRKGNDWSEPRNMGSQINSRYWDSSPSLSADGRTIYFSSKRPGGHGNADIYKVSLNSNNKWDAPVNLGPTINTAGNDEAPFIHPDGTSLYFTSDGHVGLGSFDIYLSRQENNEWQDPTNLGYPINTEKREGGLFVDLQGQRAYYSSQIDFQSDNKNLNSGDIYYFDLPKEYKPELVSYIRVEVRDATTQGLINTKAEIRSLVSSGSSDRLLDINGTLLTTIKPGEYALTISKEGYLFHSENIVLEQGATLADPFDYKVMLQRIVKEKKKEEKPPAPIVLNNIFFASGSSELLSASDVEISKLVSLLNSNSGLKIKILGHTDDVGSSQDNLDLSTRRAMAVSNRLVSAGTEDGRQTNRRTEFVLID